jgi:hypothetical protein
MKLSKKIALRAVLLGAMAVPTLLIPAYGQQEMDPTWYDPWPATKTAVQPAQTKSVAYKNHGKVNSASAEQPRNKSKKFVQVRVPHRTQQTQAMLVTK